jgi:hypothetical protein
MPVHSVELGHLVLLNVNIQDSRVFSPLFGVIALTFVIAYQPSDFAIVNTDGHSDFDVENSLSLRDAKNRKLQLKLNYVYDLPYLIVTKLELTQRAVVILIQVVPSKCRFIAHTSLSTRRGSLSA